MQALLEELKQTRQSLTDVVSAISDDDIDIIPFEGSWTVGQVLEHLSKSVSTGVLRGNVQQVSRPADEKIAFVKSVFLDFTKKFNAPEFIVPSETVHNKAEQIALLTAKFDRLIAAVDSFDLTEECVDYAIPGFGNFTRMEWIAFHMIHTQRHIGQLKRIAAALNKTA